MEGPFLCPRTELCYVYQIYIKGTGDQSMGVISCEKIENQDYYGCKALSFVDGLRHKGKLSEEDGKRIPEGLGCLVITQMNKLVSLGKRRPDA